MVPPPQAQAPIVSTLPPMPPLAFPNVELGKSKPVPKPAPPVPAPTPKKTQTAHRRLRHKPHRREPENTETPTSEESPSAAHPTAPAKGTAVLGQLSADDTTANPDQKVEIKNLIQSTQKRLDKLSNTQKTKHKDDVVQVESFLQQAEQAWNMNDLVGSQTLANKAKILMDELLK